MQNISETIKIEQRDHLLFVALNRPDKRNAINDETILAIENVFSNMPKDVKCAIIHAVGKHFSAGLDLSALRERNASEGVFHSRMWHRALEKVQFGTVPVVAVLHGACVGGGASVRLPKLIGMARMTDMMLTGRVYSATEGAAIGMAQYLEDDGKGLEKATELALKISQNAGMTNYALMHVLPRIVDAGQDGGLMMESLIAAIAQDAPEAKERLADFLEGRAKKVGE